MKYRYSSVGLMVALAAPLTVLSQDVVYTTVEVIAPPVIKTVIEGEGGNYANELIAVKSTTPTPTSTPVAVVVPTPSSSTTPVVVVPSPISSAPISSSTPSSSGGGGFTGSTNCQGSGMMIEWTSNSETVPWSWSGGSGSTTPGSCTDLGSFNGQLAVNGTGGTIFEGNYNGGSMYFDVSFIIGYSAPMVCATSTGMSGCSIDLHANAAKSNFECPQPGEGGICTNPVGSNGNATPGAYQGSMGASPWCRACSAPHEFFQPCAGSGYTYPYDDGATQVATGTIQCCIGTSCGTTGREGSTKNGHPEPNRSSEPCTVCSGGSKRGLEDVFGQAEKEKRDTTLSKRHKRLSHRHAHAHGGS